MCIAIQSRTCTSRLRPPPRSRTWTSRVSAKCADQLRQGRMWCRTRWEHVRHRVSSGALPGTSSSSLFDFHRRPAAPSSGAPRASARPRSSRAHRSRSLIWIANPDMEYAKLYCIDHHRGPRRVPVRQVCGSSVRQRMLRRWSCRQATCGPAGLGAAPKQERATWFPRVALSQSTLSRAGTSGWSPPGRTYLRRYQERQDGR